VNGCDGFSDGICDMLHQVSAGQNEEAAEEAAEEGATLEELSAKGCKNLTAFWLGVAPLDQPSAKQPVDYPELGQAVLHFQAWRPSWLPNPLPGQNLESLRLRPSRSARGGGVLGVVGRGEGW